MLSILLSNKILNIFQSFVIQVVEFWPVPSEAEVLIDIVVCLEKLSSVARFDAVGLYEVGTDNVKKDNLVVAFVGCDRKLAGLIGITAPWFQQWS